MCLIVEVWQYISLTENFCASIQILLKFAFKGPINNKTTLVQVMVWRHTTDKPLTEPIMKYNHACISQIQQASMN